MDIYDFTYLEFGAIYRKFRDIKAYIYIYIYTYIYIYIYIYMYKIKPRDVALRPGNVTAK